MSEPELLTFRKLQVEVKEWSERNFGNQPAHRPLLGVAEETGELCHAHLKMEQGIRGTTEQHRMDALDAVGDILVYLADYCSRMQFDMQQAIETTWAKVKQRDWTKNKDTGGEEQVPIPPPGWDGH